MPPLNWLSVLAVLSLLFQVRIFLDSKIVTWLIAKNGIRAAG